MKDIRVGCIGCGKMGGAIVKGIAKNINSKNIAVCSGHFEKAQAFAKENDMVAYETAFEVCENSDVIFIGVKPNKVEEILQELTRCNDFGNKIVVSMAAGVTLQQMKEFLFGNCKSFFRIMPNVGALYGEAMTGLCCYDLVSQEDVQLVTELLECCGKVEKVNENLMEGVTAVSGSGPAYVFMFIEALADAAVKFGIPRDQAYIYAAQTVKGAAVMALEDDRSISELKDSVCSPGGTTIEAVAALEQEGFRGTVIKGATACFEKACKMSKK